MINKKFKINDIVKLLLNEIGIIKEINIKSLDWFPFKVKIIKATLNDEGDILEYKKDQLVLMK